MGVTLCHRTNVRRTIASLIGILGLAIPVPSVASGLALNPQHCTFPTSESISEIVSRSKLFYVDLFGGPWPIPDRYELMGVSGSGAIRMSSPPQTCLIGSHLCKKPIGIIRYGKFQKNGEPKSVEQIAPKAGMRFSKDAKSVDKDYHGLRVRILTQKLGSKQKPLQTVVIYNSKEYIIIADQNRDLWKCMLIFRDKFRTAEGANREVEAENR